MSDERTRQRNDDRPAQGSPGGGDTGLNLAQIRERAERLRKLGSGIIQDALSGNSERFLEQSRQQGGQ